MRTFEFKFQNNKSSKYIGYGLLGLFATMTLSLSLTEVFQWKSSLPALFIASLLLGIGSLAYGIWKFSKLAKSADRIVLKDEGFDSEFHGYILFSDIESISGFGLLGAAPPSMKIRLRSGKKIVWYLTPTTSSFNTEEDAEIFKAFTVALGDRLAAYERIVNATSERSLADKEPEAKVETVSETDTDTGKLSEQVREVTKKHNRAIWTVPVGLVFAVLAFTRTCGEDYFKNKRDKEVQQIFINSDIRFDQLVEESKEILDHYVPSLGAIYLYSNDKDIDVKLMPDLPENTLLNATPTLARAAQSKHLRKLIKHPDSTDFLTLLIHPDQNIQPMTKSRLNRLDSTNTWLYLRFFDAHKQINPNPHQKADVDSTTFVPMDIRTGIAIYEDQSIRQSLDNAMIGLRMMLAQAKHSKTFNIYLTGAEKDQVSEELFHQVKNELQALLQDVGVDTSTFRSNVFNRPQN